MESLSENDASPAITRTAAFWLGIAITLTLINHAISLKRPYNYPNDTISALNSTMARSFAENGVLRLGGVPIQNNPPLGLKPDSYTHWPPLFPILLGFLFSALGESEQVAHTSMLCILIVSAGLFYLLVSFCLGRLAGLLAGFSWLVLPVSVLCGHVVLHLHLAILFLLAALFGYLKATRTGQLEPKWVLFGCAALGAAVLSSWEPVFVCPGLLAAALWTRQRSQVRLSLLYLFVATVVSAGQITGYALQRPDLTEETWRKLKWRIGLPDKYLADAEYPQPTGSPQSSPMPAVGWVLQKSAKRLAYVGWAPLTALIWLVLRGLGQAFRRTGGAAVFLMCGFLSVWCGWFGVFSQHAMIHAFQMLLGAPAAAMAIGWAGITLARRSAHSTRQSNRPPAEWLLFLLVPAIMLQPLVTDVYKKVQINWNATDRAAFGFVVVRSDVFDDTDEIKLGRQICRTTPPGAVVMVSEGSMVPVFYSKRHTIRGIWQDFVLEGAVEKLRPVFPEAPFYLAIMPKNRIHFPAALKKYKTVAQTSELLLLAVLEK